jgi:hypothetical protein
MVPEPDERIAEPSEPPPSPPPRPGRAASVAPTLAVLAVAGVAVAAAFMGERPDSRHAETAVAPPPPARQAVVRAPPQVVTAPPLKPVAPSGQRARPGAENRNAATAMGAGPACSGCGVVESVVVARPRSSFQMRIRMDDGTLRTVEQRGALAAGTRVVVEGETLRVLPG